MIGTNFPVDGIEQLASRVKSEGSKLSSELDALHAACQRDPNFSGSAAQSYDQYMQKWTAGQRQLLDALNGAGDLLQRMATQLRAQDQAVAQSFNA